MTTEQLFDDLKQFIRAEISASESRLDTRIDALDGRIEALDGRIEALDDKINTVQRELTTLITDGFRGVAEVVDQHQNQLDDHDRRLLRLEGRTEPLTWKPTH